MTSRLLKMNDVSIPVRASDMSKKDTSKLLFGQVPLTFHVPKGAVFAVDSYGFEQLPGLRESLKFSSLAAACAWATGLRDVSAAMAEKMQAGTGHEYYSVMYGDDVARALAETERRCVAEQRQAQRMGLA